MPVNISFFSGHEIFLIFRAAANMNFHRLSAVEHLNVWATSLHLKASVFSGTWPCLATIWTGNENLYSTGISSVPFNVKISCEDQPCHSCELLTNTKHVYLHRGICNETQFRRQIICKLSQWHSGW
jgi:hypothetical protein